MSQPASCIYAGAVVHKRLTPRRHAFRYRVFALCLDVDEIGALSRRLRFFSRNRFNLLSFHDADHGAGDGREVGDHVRGLLDQAGLANAGAGIRLLCYPRLLGFVFNPLSVYFCHDADGRLAAIVYEVSNTFAERTAYIIPVDGPVAASGIVGQSCAKRMYVSPFTEADARYGFHVLPPNERVVVGVDLRSAAGPVLKTHFQGARETLSDPAILALLARYPLMTLKVVAAIHLEAGRLWWKGVPLVARHASPRFTVAVTRSHARDASHA